METYPIILTNKKIIQYSKQKSLFFSFQWLPLTTCTLKQLKIWGNSEKNRCAFNLNEEHGSDDMSVSTSTISATPIPIVPTSKPAGWCDYPEMEQVHNRLKYNFFAKSCMSRYTISIYEPKDIDFPCTSYIGH